MRREDISFEANDIRPQPDMSIQDNLLHKDMDHLFRHLSEFIDVNCPACDRDKSTHCFNKHRFQYVKCSLCDTVYISPRPTAKLLGEYYTGSERYAYWNSFVYPHSEDVRRQKIDRPRVQKIVDLCERLDIKGKSILEIGPGFGTFAEEMKKTGLFTDTLLIEPHPDLANTCRKRGLRVAEETIEQLNLRDSKYDVIVGFEVFEHLFSPKDFLIKMLPILSPSGLLVLTCPNIKGFDIQVLGSESDAIDNENLTYFHPQSLTKLLESCGYEVVEVATPGKLDTSHVRNKIIQGKIDVSLQPFFQEVMIRNWDRLGSPFQEFLSDNLLSSHMWVVARKNPGRRDT
ncbi:class I SAM-dependent methyltransferase [Desulfosporosinus fructosivorans]